MITGVNLLEGLNDNSAGFFEKRWKEIKKNYEIDGLMKEIGKLIYETFEDEFSEKKEKTFLSSFIKDKSSYGPKSSYSFSTSLEDHKKTLRGPELKVWDKGEDKAVLFNKFDRKIYIFEKNKPVEIIPFSHIKHTRLRYRPCLIQSIKVRFQITFILAGYNNKILRFSDTVSCYDDDRRSYETQMKPFVKNCKKLAGTGRWNFRTSCSTTF